MAAFFFAENHPRKPRANILSLETVGARFERQSIISGFPRMAENEKPQYYYPNIHHIHSYYTSVITLCFWRLQKSLYIDLYDKYLAA